MGKGGNFFSNNLFLRIGKTFEGRDLHKCITSYRTLCTSHVKSNTVIFKFLSTMWQLVSPKNGNYRQNRQMIIRKRIHFIVRTHFQLTPLIPCDCSCQACTLSGEHSSILSSKLKRHPFVEPHYLCKMGGLASQVKLGGENSIKGVVIQI